MTTLETIGIAAIVIFPLATYFLLKKKPALHLPEEPKYPKEEDLKNAKTKYEESLTAYRNGRHTT